jgi:hypothetical protein
MEWRLETRCSHKRFSAINGATSKVKFERLKGQLAQQAGTKGSEGNVAKRRPGRLGFFFGITFG